MGNSNFWEIGLNNREVGKIQTLKRYTCDVNFKFLRNCILDGILEKSRLQKIEIQLHRNKKYQKAVSRVKS